MTASSTFQTERLILRPLCLDDFELLASLNRDPRVMEHFPALLGAAETQRQLGRLLSHREAHGFGTWVATLGATGESLGVFGLQHVDFQAAFTPAVEVFWRMVPASWGRGYATEAARSLVRFGFQQLELARIVGFTAARNGRSLALFGRIGMKPDARFDFDHPKLPLGHPLRRHLFFEARRSESGNRLLNT
ncbi:MAG: N-acetyltransferase [Myxococcales bacterium]|nr:MAG: N-acetyltransferase [Myxococcales bacterium]